MDLGLRDRACVVTGASRGIGLAITRRLVDEGARVLIADVVAFLCSERAGNVVGAAWSADSGAVASIF